jgi:N-acetylmuramoyl-L-alanine amidase
MKFKNIHRIIFVGLPILLLLTSIFLLPESKADSKIRKGDGLKTVVIDAGHGGHDSGCHGAAAYEKHVALSISLKLGKLIEQYFPDVKVIYTRKTDVFVELYRRAQIANENKADLFICIHCNSGPKTAYGTETFVMGLHKSDDNLNVAKRENAVILQEDNYQRQYDGFDPNSAEANIIFSLYQNAFLDQSLYFAGSVQDELTGFAKRHNRGVKQAGFLVLFKTTMPSVLIETGFLTHGDEERYLKSEAGQDQIAEGILRAFKNYKTWIDGVFTK